jgi:hypothetical protein
MTQRGKRETHHPGPLLPGEAAYVCAEDLLMSNGERVWRIYGKSGHEFLVPLLGPIGEILIRRSSQISLTPWI